MVKICFVLTLSLLGVRAQSSSVSTTVPVLGKENAELTRLPQADVIGFFVNIIDNLLKIVTRMMPPPNGSVCKTILIKVGRSEMKISGAPRGRCLYCCHLANPAKYIKLSLTNKARGNNALELNLKKERGLLRAAGINSDLPTVMYIHGFLGYRGSTSSTTIRDVFLSLDQDYNIILVDWGELSSFPWYPQAVDNMKLVGTSLSKFLQFYDESGELPVSKLHIIGYSLGAHMAGIIGKAFQNTKISRISALNPAFPLLPLNDSSQVISKTDADFVDVIHTSPGAFGVATSMGHADFYPNAEFFIQPGCDADHLPFDGHIVEQYIWCSHMRAWRFYTESVRNPLAFPATKCGIVREKSVKHCRFVTDGYMGFAASKNTTFGDFYLSTNDRKPYGRSAKEQEAAFKTINLML